jgi:hypothetical protein
MEKVSQKNSIDVAIAKHHAKLASLDVKKAQARGEMTAIDEFAATLLEEAKRFLEKANETAEGVTASAWAV